MLIQTEITPNPCALKFIPGPRLLAQPMDFPNQHTGQTSPLAMRLFSLNGVKSVFIGEDFLTVTKEDIVEWDTLKPQLSAAIYDHLSSGKPVISETTPTEPTALTEDAEGVVKDIQDILNTRVRPAVAQDGGDIVFEKFEDGVVYLRLKGACSGCPSSTITLKSGIENMLRYYVPEVQEVRSVDE